MDVTVEFITPLNRAAGVSHALVMLPDGGTMNQLIAALREQFPAVSPAAERAMYLVNRTLAHRETVLTDGDRVLMMQILGGG
ncbi:MAG TPA: MoaD/ThiS family protein [Chloroflexota bacterium]|nr:MoaD/ThiS family protein [Chloroflexota bacterium]